MLFLVFCFSNQRSRAKMAQEQFTLQMGYPMLVPLIELKSESGLAYDTAIECHYKLLSRYMKAVEECRPPLPLRLFAFPSETINFNGLKRLKNELGKPLLQVETGKPLVGKEKNDEARRRIEEVKKPASELLIELQQLLSKPIIPLRLKEIPAGLREDVEKVLKEGHDKVNAYVKGVEDNIELTQSVENSGLACHENRKAVSLSFLASYMYEDFFVSKKTLTQFREDIDRCIDYNDRLCKSLSALEDEANKADIKRLGLYSQSELRRRDLVQAIIDDDMEKAQELLLAAMTKAISEEKSLVKVD
jgi:hypothetical protein